MPVWTTRPIDDGERHQLLGNRVLANVDVLPADRSTVINVVLLVPGTDEATVQRCKDRAERLLIEVQRA
jgi:hypothetical protein